MQPLSAFAVIWIGISRFHRQLIPYPAKHPTHCPITVARAAPAVPIAGMPKYPKIRIGSKTLGEGDQEKVKKTASAALVLAFLAWVLVSLLEVSAMRPYFRWQSGGNETIMDYGIPYLRMRA